MNYIVLSNFIFSIFFKINDFEVDLQTPVRTAVLDMATLPLVSSPVENPLWAVDFMHGEAIN